MSSYANQVLAELADYEGWDFAGAGVTGSEQFFSELGRLVKKVQTGALSAGRCAAPQAVL
jgi:hypothetical protein